MCGRHQVRYFLFDIRIIYLFVEDEGGNIIVKKEKILERWSKYFIVLLNEESEYTINETVREEGPSFNPPHINCHI